MQSMPVPVRSDGSAGWCFPARSTSWDRPFIPNTWVHRWDRAGCSEPKAPRQMAPLSCSFHRSESCCVYIYIYIFSRKQWDSSKTSSFKAAGCQTRFQRGSALLPAVKRLRESPLLPARGPWAVTRSRIRQVLWVILEAEGILGGSHSLQTPGCSVTWGSEAPKGLGGSWGGDAAGDALPWCSKHRQLPQFSGCRQKAVGVRLLRGWMEKSL